MSAGAEQRTHDEALVVAMAQGSVDPMLVVSMEGVVLRANEAAQQIFGEQIVGQSFGIPASPGRIAEIELLTDGGPRTAELRTGTAEVLDERVYVVSLRDVTERKRAEHALRDFVTTASHEFRTPLFAIAGFGETLEDQWDELSVDDRRRYVSIIHRQARRLTRLTDDLLTVARLDGEELAASRRSTMPRVVVDRALELLDRDDVDVEVEEDVHVMVDPDHLEDILINLLTNAEKYGAPPYEVVATPHDGEVELRIIDHGPGVPSEFRARMFERFARERRAARAHPGTGLGLHIAQGLVERNQGTLSYETTPGGGATFVVTLPMP